MRTEKRSRLVDAGLFMLRLGIGVMFVLHGTTMLLGGKAAWTELGRAVSSFGLTEHHVWWGLAAGVTACAAGLMLIFGWVVRLASFALLVMMVACAARHFVELKGFFLIKDNVKLWGPPVHMGVVFIALMLTGAGGWRFKLPAKKQKPVADPQTAPVAKVKEAPKPEPTPEPHHQ
jgi:putative oxidoreductase